MLAAHADAKGNYVTVRVGDWCSAGLIPLDHNLKHGDQIFSEIGGVIVTLKLNRKNGSTLAGHLPEGFELPEVGKPKVYAITVLGPLRGARATIIKDTAMTDEAIAEMQAVKDQNDGIKLSLIDTHCPEPINEPLAEPATQVDSEMDHPAVASDARQNLLAALEEDAEFARNHKGRESEPEGDSEGMGGWQ